MPTHIPSALNGSSIQERLNWLIGHMRSAENADYIGEGVSQLTHALQCASLASNQHDPELVLASLMHDIGHLVPSNEPTMEGLGTRNHESVGARVLLGLGFSPRVARLVEGHVDAKRYLASTRKGYLSKLSSASRRTLDLQGGPMSADEQAAFEHLSEFSDLIRLRGWDEGGKSMGRHHQSLDAFLPLIESHLSAQNADQLVSQLHTPLSEEQRSSWQKNQTLMLPGIFKGPGLHALQEWTSDLAHRAERAGLWMKYFERTSADDRQLCRIEDFVPYHAGMDALLRGPQMLARVSELMGEPAILFKEKINFKLAGGAGFSAHQDAPAFDAFGHRYHITVLITVDPSDRSNGGLEFGEPTPPYQILTQNPDGTVADHVTQAMTWTPMDLPAGSVVFFDSYIPHRSPRNKSQRPRRSLYITYNRASEGDCRAQYYADKRATFPPEIERDPTVDYLKNAGRYNLANPIR